MHRKGGDLAADTQLDFVPLDNAIVMSILSTAPSLAAPPIEPGADKIVSDADKERIKRLFGSLLVVGGGFAKIPGAADMLQERLVNAYHFLLPELFGISTSALPLERIYVIPTPRDMDPCHLSWKGGAVASRLESVLRDGWISRLEWQQHGARALRDKAFFHW